MIVFLLYIEILSYYLRREVKSTSSLLFSKMFFHRFSIRLSDAWMCFLIQISGYFYSWTSASSQSLKSALTFSLFALDKLYAFWCCNASVLHVLLFIDNQLTKRLGRCLLESMHLPIRIHELLYWSFVSIHWS